MSVATMIFASRIKNWWPKAQEDGKAEPSSRHWLADDLPPVPPQNSVRL
jgi:hypothetical protein